VILSSASAARNYKDYFGFAPCTTYYYRVKAFRGDGNPTEYGAILSTATAPALIETPENFTATRETNQPEVFNNIKLSWKSPYDLSRSSAAEYYDIRYSTSLVMGDQGFEQLKSITALYYENGLSSRAAIPAPQAPGTVQSIEHIVTLLGGTTNYFYIKAKNTHGVESIMAMTSVYINPFIDIDGDGDLDMTVEGSVVRNFSSEMGVNNAPPCAPAAPNVTISSFSVLFAWNPSTDDLTPQAGLTYDLYIATFPYGPSITPLSQPFNARRGSGLIIRQARISCRLRIRQRTNTFCLERSSSRGDCGDNAGRCRARDKHCHNKNGNCRRSYA